MNSAIGTIDSFTAQNALGGASLRRGVAAKGDAAIDKAASEFESMFMSQMIQPMFEGLEVDETFGGGRGEEMMRGMMVQEYGRAMAEGMPSGIADAVKKEMIKRAQSKQTAGATQEVIA